MDDVEVAVGRVLDRANRRFDAAIRELSGEPPLPVLTTAQVWEQLGIAPRAAMSSLVEGVRRAAIALPIMLFGTPEQKRMVEQAMHPDRSE